MKLTNNHDLPEAFMRFEEKNSYSKGDSEFSISTLIDAPQINYLKEKHDAEIEEDISGRILSILGTSIHYILEHGASERDITERRFYAEVLGKRISGQVDRLGLVTTEDDTKVYRLQDYKTVRGSALAINPNGSEQWQKQINGYAYLARMNDIEIEGADVIAVVRDWNQASARRDNRFPKQAVVKIEIPLWEFEEQQRFIEQCVRDHSSEEPRQCTQEERWKGKSTYAVMEYAAAGGFKKRAKRLFPSRVEAEGFIVLEGLNAEIVERESVATRCIGNYCLVAQFCEQFQSE